MNCPLRTPPTTNYSYIRVQCKVGAKLLPLKSDLLYQCGYHDVRQERDQAFREQCRTQKYRSRNNIQLEFDNNVTILHGVCMSPDQVQRG